MAHLIIHRGIINKLYKENLLKSFKKSFKKGYGKPIVTLPTGFEFKGPVTISDHKIYEIHINKAKKTPSPICLNELLINKASNIIKIGPKRCK